jgi:hypothetical protein
MTMLGTRALLGGLIVAMGACSSKSKAPPPAPTGGSGSAAAAVAMKPPEPPPIRPIDLPAAGVTKLTVHPTVDPSNEIVADWYGKDRNATLVCRVDAYNLVAFDPREREGLAPGEHTLMWTPQPFVIAPKVCEIRFVDHGKLLAAACWHPGRLDPTECAGGDLPPPKQPEHVAIYNVEGSTLSVSGNDVAISALVTQEAALEDNHETHFALRCDGAGAKTVSEDDDRIAAIGAERTAFASLQFTFAKPVQNPPKACELRVLVKRASLPKPIVDGTFCIHEGSTDVGKCDS